MTTSAEYRERAERALYTTGRVAPEPEQVAEAAVWAQLATAAAIEEQGARHGQ
jgi:hypothetical protein